MNRRLYFVLPDTTTAHQVERELLLARIEDRRMHFVGKRGTDLGDLPQATNFQKSDIRHGLFVGLVAGTITGALFGVVLYLNPALVGIPVNPGVVLALGAFGGAFGSVTSGFFIGSSTPNVHLHEFEGDFAKGRIVLILDVPKDRAEEVAGLIRSHFPAAEDHGVDATTPAFP